jgi:fatty acid desaturase
MGPSRKESTFTAFLQSVGEDAATRLRAGLGVGALCAIGAFWPGLPLYAPLIGFGAGFVIGFVLGGLLQED